MNYHQDDYKYNVSEEGLRDWFGKSSGTTKSGRKVRGWVQVGGKYDGKPCARQPGQKSTPKCVSSSKRRSMSKKERDSAARRKRWMLLIQINHRRTGTKQQNQQTFLQILRRKCQKIILMKPKTRKARVVVQKMPVIIRSSQDTLYGPSAYASGALVKCRKVGAANWGNKTKKEGFSPMQVAALESCWYD